MTYAVTDFKSIKRIVDRREQKAEFEEKNPKPPAWYSNAIVWTPEYGYAPPPSDAA
jgi:hypothetical protein